MSAPDDYQAKGEGTYFDDGRELELLKYVEDKCEGQAKVEPKDILRLIDEYGAAHKFLMNVGARKGAIVTEIIEQRKPQVMIELGSYVGYSMLLFAAALRQNGGTRYVCFERSQTFADITQKFSILAGLHDVVHVVVGPSSQNLVGEHAAGRLDRVDVAFIDHYKPAYLRDIKVLESLGLVRKDTLLVADNMINPGNPPYKEYVRSTPEEKKRLAEAVKKDKLNRDQFPTWTATQYDQPYEENETELPGVPEIVYKSHMVESYEPTGDPDGVEITVCVSVPESN